MSLPATTLDQPATDLSATDPTATDPTATDLAATYLAATDLQSAGTTRSLTPRALVVDDHVDTAELFQMLLAKRGIDVVIAGTLEAALEAARTSKFDILISDIDLPDGSGCDLLEEVRRLQSVPAIAVSGLGGENVLKRCKAVGFDELFVKPASFQRVLDATLRLLSQR